MGLGERGWAGCAGRDCGVLLVDFEVFAKNVEFLPLCLLRIEVFVLVYEVFAGIRHRVPPRPATTETRSREGVKDDEGGGVQLGYGFNGFNWGRGFHGAVLLFVYRRELRPVCAHRDGGGISVRSWGCGGWGRDFWG